MAAVVAALGLVPVAQPPAEMPGQLICKRHPENGVWASTRECGVGGGTQSRPQHAAAWRENSKFELSL